MNAISLDVPHRCNMPLRKTKQSASAVANHITYINHVKFHYHLQVEKTGWFPWQRWLKKIVCCPLFDQSFFRSLATQQSNF